MKILKKIKKIILVKFILVFAMMFSISLASLNLNTVNAWDDTVPYEFTRVKNIKYPEWWGRKIPSLKSWSTYSTQYNGKWAYCLESSKNTPQNGNYTSEVITNNSAVRKLLYYGFGGPAAWGQFADGFDLKQAICPDDDYLTNDDVKYLLTHIFLSGAYSNDWNGFDEQLFNQYFGGTYGTNIMNIYRNILNLPDPEKKGQVGFEDNYSDLANFNAEFDKENKIQITNTVKFNGTNSAIINIPLADNVTIHIVGTNESQTGGIATVYGGQSFYFTAPLLNLSNVNISLLNATGIEKFTALAINCGSNTNQIEGSWTWDPDVAELYYSINWLDIGSLELRKTNDVGNFIDGAEFSLESVSFDGYSEKLVVKDGKIKIDNLPVGIYRLTETKVPDGHAIIQTVYEVEIKKDETTDRVVVNKLRPTGSLIINKSLENENEEMPLSEENSNTVNVADYDFSKVQFKITANQVIKDSVSLEILYEKGDSITVGSGKGSNQDIVGLISGKDLGKGVYTPDNNGRLELNGLPMGSYDVEEISCPDGFVLDKEIKTVQFVQEDFVTLSYTKSLNIKNKITKTLLSKVDVGGIQINGAHMQILNKDKEVVYEFVTGDEPLQIDGLKDGKYYFHEDLSPLGFALSNDIEFTVKDSEIQKVEMIDYTVDVAKVDEQSNYLKGVGLEIVSEKTKNIIDKWTTGEHIFDFSDEMIAKLENNEIVSDMFISEDDSTVLYKAVKTNKDDYMLMLQSNGEINYYFVDRNGDETRHLVRNLINDSSYILRETDVPKGYSTAEEQKFTLKDENVSLTMINETIKTSWHKVDVLGNELEGAYLRVTELDGTVIDEWISTKEPHAINGVLEKNKEYYFEETIAPDGYELAQKVKFKIDDMGKIQHFYLTNNLKPKKIETGDNSDISSYLGLGFVSVGGIILISVLRKKGKVIGK
ncbi:SpaA isopeptide-forming pilin-related protein [Thomasclavelia cocleata]|uniref:SpaA isopeptide-forming pilin-related protein n=2 Tax=Thomasclavelia cocleata TaxID=69824 RepID=UPI00255B14BF|nr:SpaA isopeptide-forming pilin-related protein [Thomasclavelia cocleata]